MARKGELPHCVSACPNGVFIFGDMNEDSVTNGAETFRFSELIKDKAGYRLMEDLGTKPSVYYLPPVNRNFPFESGLENEIDEDKKNIKIIDRGKLNFIHERTDNPGSASAKIWQTGNDMDRRILILICLDRGICLLPAIEIWTGGYQYAGLCFLGNLYFQFCFFCCHQSGGITDHCHFQAGQCKMEHTTYTDCRNHCRFRHRVCFHYHYC